MQGLDLACDQKQLDYLARPMTPGEEEIMGIYEDEVYRPPESGYDRETRREKPGGFQIRRFCVRPGRSVQQKMNLMQETLLLVEQLFTDLL